MSKKHPTTEEKQAQARQHRLQAIERLTAELETLRTRSDSDPADIQWLNNQIAKIQARIENPPLKIQIPVRHAGAPLSWG